VPEVMTLPGKNSIIQWQRL